MAISVMEQLRMQQMQQRHSPTILEQLQQSGPDNQTQRKQPSARAVNSGLSTLTQATALDPLQANFGSHGFNSSAPMAYPSHEINPGDSHERQESHPQAVPQQMPISPPGASSLSMDLSGNSPALDGISPLQFSAGMGSAFSSPPKSVQALSDLQLGSPDLRPASPKPSSMQLSPLQDMLPLTASSLGKISLPKDLNLGLLSVVLPQQPGLQSEQAKLPKRESPIKLGSENAMICSPESTSFPQVASLKAFSSNSNQSAPKAAPLPENTIEIMGKIFDLRGQIIALEKECIPRLVD